MAARLWAAGVLLCLGLARVAPARRRDKDDGAGAELAEHLSRARCTSRCLALHMAQLSETFRSLQTDDILTWCDTNRRCSQCVQPCKGFWDPHRKPCLGKCENHSECLTSCAFLRSLQTLKQGDCPPPQKASGFAAACVQSCGLDDECPGSRKCCSNDCGYTCQIPANIYKGVPLKPRKEISFVEQSNGSLGLSWKSKFNVSVEPVFFLLQRRWNFGIHPNEDESTQWQTVAMTAHGHAHLQDTRPNRWYQFRVAAVNVHGTRGFTTPSKHFHSFRDPLPPNSPRNLRSGNFTVSADGTFSLILSWDSAQEEDLDIHHYKISWSYWAPRKHVLLAKKDHWKLTDGVKPEVQLDGLQPNTEYVVQVQAISCWGQKRLKSPKSLLHVTVPLLDLKAHDLSPDVEVSNELPTLHQTSLKRKMGADSLYHQHSRLQEKTYWKKAEGRHLLSRKVKLTPVFRSANGSISGEFHWEVLQRGPSQEQQVTSYQFRWVRLPDSGRIGAAPDKGPSQTLTLPPAQPFVVINGLLPLTLYQTEVQVLSTTAHGPATMKTFRTPAINETGL